MIASVAHLERRLYNKSMRHGLVDVLHFTLRVALFFELFEIKPFILMSKTVEYEPYLTEYDVVFHGIFTLIDPAMNTSEIKPLHLAVPRNRQGMRLTPPTQPNVNTVPAENQDTSPKRNQRFLSNRYLTQKPTPAKPSLNANAIAETAKKIVDPEQPPAQQVKQPPQQQPPRPRPTQTLSESDNLVVTQMLMKTDDFWILPLSPSVTVRFLFTVDGNSGPGYVFRMLSEGTNTMVLSARMNGASRAAGLQFYFGDATVGEAKYNTGNASFFAGVDTPKGRCEACAAVFNPSFTSPVQPRIFDFLVPALKKIDGKSRMFPIQFSDVSGLVTRLSQMSKEAIRLKTRIPAATGKGDWDMTFGGKLENNSNCNFVLYHDSNMKKDLCEFWMKRENEYALEIGYPLSPLQGFIAAIAASMPV